MSSSSIRRSLSGVCAIITVLFLVAAIAVAQPTTTKATTSTGSSSVNSQLEGTVVAADGNNVVVKMSSGEIRHFVAPEGRRALIDGKEVAAKDLKIGTKLKATITTTTTSLMDRTTTVGTGKVFFVSGPNLILTLPNGENRQYKVKSDYKFTVEGKPATVFDLRKGMIVSAQKIVEEPRIVVAANTVVTGELPPPVKTEVAAVPAIKPKPVPAPEPVAKPAPAPAPAPAPVAEAPPTRLPKTASPLPLIGLCGFLLTAGSLVSMRLGRRA